MQHIWSKSVVSWHLLITFFITWNHICIFSVTGKLTFFNARVQGYSKSFEIDSPQILNIRILIIPWPWGLLGIRSCIIFAISLLLSEVDEITFSFLLKNVEGCLLELFFKEHCSAKKELHIFTFSLKVANLFWWLDSWIQKIFLFSIYKVEQ